MASDDPTDLPSIPHCPHGLTYAVPCDRCDDEDRECRLSALQTDCASLRSENARLKGDLDFARNAIGDWNRENLRLLDRLSAVEKLVGEWRAYRSGYGGEYGNGLENASESCADDLERALKGGT